MESTKSQGRNLWTNALAPAAPSAPANPNGRQHAIVASELIIAARDAEMPEPCFIPSLLCGACYPLLPSSFLPGLLQRGFNLILKLSYLGNYRRFIDSEQFLVAHHRAAADDYRLHIASLQGIRQLRIDVVQRHGVRRIEAYQNNVRFLPCFERANFLVHVQRTRTLDGGH